MRHLLFKSCISLFIIFTLSIFPLLSQVAITSEQPEENSYGVDHTNNIIVWNTSEILDNGNLDSLVFYKTYSFDTIVNKLSKKHPYKITNTDSVYHLFTTSFPIVNMTVASEIDDNTKVDAIFRYYDQDTTFTSTIGIEHRGNISLKFPKKSYDIEFWKDSISKKSKDVNIGNLREDDDFVLDAMYNEPLRMRANFSQKLWRKIYQPYYIESEPKARSGIGEQYVEVFINEIYKGVYLFIDQVDRKLLKLKKKNAGVVYGELYKAARYDGATEFKVAPPFKSSLPHWGGFRLEYPGEEDYVYFFENIQKTTAFVVNSSKAEFAANFRSHFDEKNLIDYYLFINLLRGTDNLGKNYFIAKHDKDTPYFIVPWDLDGVLGTVIDGREMNITTDILTNNLFSRLWEENPNNYRTKAIARWQELRESDFSNEALFGSIEDHVLKFKEDQLYNREAMIWGQTHSNEELTYMTNWLEKRLIFLDAYFKE